MHPPLRTPGFPSLAAAVLVMTFLTAADRPDVVVADFEGDDYGGWTATGGAFGKAPARGALPGQMAVTGFLGRGLVNSFAGDDSSTGTLTSPPFTIERPYLNFLIGGGKYPGETCLNLLVGGSVVRTATGPNDRPGGSERLDWASWDVAGLVGKRAVLEIVDTRTGGWGHINVDQIVQGDRKRATEPAARELVVAARYLHLPVRNDATPRRVKIVAGGETVREFDIKLAEGAPEFWVFSDLTPFRGKSVTVEADLPSGSKALETLTQAEEVPGASGLYREANRPRFHFTSRRGWLNDPNGLAFFDGEYHLYYQHNPYGWDWGNMHWGHAVSPDLVHWSELPIALTPRKYGDWCFSGSAVVDKDNTSGFGKGGSAPLVIAYTSTGRGECIAYSNDRGRTFTEFEGNPVVKHRGRDPRLLWHAATSRWVMAIYDEADGKREIAFKSSPDLKTWSDEGRIDGFYECPDLFELPVAGKPGETRWVLYAADGEYVTGTFDGKSFTPDTRKQTLWYGDFYAAQTYSNTPDGRRVQVGWARGVTFPGMPFNQQMTVPCELTLRATDDGVRLFARPVAELDSLRTNRHSWKGLGLKPGESLRKDFQADQFEVRVEAEVGIVGKLTLEVRGVPVVYDVTRWTLSCNGVSAPLPSERGVVRLRVLVDRGSVEVFGNDGRVALSRKIDPAAGSWPFAVSAAEGFVDVRSLVIDELKPAWR